MKKNKVSPCRAGQYAPWRPAHSRPVRALVGAAAPPGGLRDARAPPPIRGRTGPSSHLSRSCTWDTHIMGCQGTRGSSGGSCNAAGVCAITGVTKNNVRQTGGRVRCHALLSHDEALLREGLGRLVGRPKSCCWPAGRPRARRARQPSKHRKKQFLPRRKWRPPASSRCLLPRRRARERLGVVRIQAYHRDQLEPTNLAL